MTTSKYDMLYGRQGGRIVPFAADAHEITATCDVCGGTLTNTEASTHAECTPPDAQPSLFDAGGAS